jgi:hypothetical protein
MDTNEDSDVDDYDFADFTLEKQSSNRTQHSEEEETEYSGSGFTFLHSMQSCSEFGKINDCRISEATNNGLGTVAVCTSLGYVKIFNLENNCEIFSLRVDDEGCSGNNLTRLVYSQDFIIAAGSQGMLYFVDLKQGGEGAAEGTFLRRAMKLGECQLQSLSIYREFLICIGDSEGNVFFVSLFDL